MRYNSVLQFIVGMVAQLCDYKKILNYALWVNWMVYEIISQSCFKKQIN